ncbi:MAG: oligopeptide:H+ symporter [Planctomycetaceae bacterium]|jgi:POT family proton-dependent oligopeptide transporter|nr:oligopeptide:H+ symporter [Planctomycetaceae bacterium]
MTNNSQNIPVFPKRHPAGLWVLFTTEMWERFAFYSMRAILVLYLMSVSTGEWTPGFGWSEADAYKLYGWYTGLVYLSPLLGGWIADRFIGQRACVVIGALLMTLGEFFLAATEFIRIGGGVKVTFATDPTALIVFYIGLGLMILGNGFFKPCISVMVGQLYEQGDRRRDVAFTIFYMGINLGAFFSPLIAGTVAEIYGFHLGFIIAGFGMICGLLSFIVFGRKHLKDIGGAPVRHDSAAATTEEEKVAHEKLVYEQTRPLDRKDYDRMFVIVVLSLFVIAFWMTFEQAGSSLNVFAKKNTDRNISESVIGASPEFVSDYFLDNEKVVEYQSIIVRLEKLEDQANRIGAGLEEVKRETFFERASRLLSFRKVELEQERSIAEIYPELRERAAGLKERFGENEEKAEGLEANPTNPAGETSLLKTRSGGKEYEDYEDIVKEMKNLKKIEEDLGEDFTPKANTYTFPATWYQSVNALFIIVFAPIFAVIWTFLSRFGIEPSTPTKFALGLLFVSGSFLVMIPGAIDAKATNGNAAAYWLVVCYLLATWGELCLSPIGLSMVTKLAPARYASFFMGLWFMASSVAYILAGQLASILGADDGINFFFGAKAGLADFFLVMAIIPMIIGFIALALAPKLKQMMHGAG